MHPHPSGVRLRCEGVARRAGPLCMPRLYGPDTDAPLFRKQILCRDVSSGRDRVQYPISVNAAKIDKPIIAVQRRASTMPTSRGESRGQSAALLTA